MNRTLAVAKMQLINKWTYLGIPAVILAGSFLLSLAIWAIIPNAVGTKYSGAGQAVMWYFFGLGIQSLTLSFPFSQGLSISRRTFFMGTVGLFSVIAAAVAAVYVLMGALEQATDGWGLNGRMFAMDWLARESSLVQFLFYFLLMMLLFLAGFWGATIYKRWQATGALIMGLALGLAVVGGMALITWQGWWGAVGDWIVALTPVSLGLLSLVLAVALGYGAYLTLRRATP